MLELNLFDSSESSNQTHLPGAPLASRLRPRHLAEYLGHGHVVSGQGLLATVFETGRLTSSFLFWGPPGSGKTTLANLVAQASQQTVHTLSAVSAGLKELREVVDIAESAGGEHLLFIDEIHRFNKTQQDALLPVIESGRLRLLGATTENPYFELRKALLSRCRVVKLEKLSDGDIIEILKRALVHPQGLASINLQIDNSSLELLARLADGDARTALNLLELGLTKAKYRPDGSLEIDNEVLEAVVTDQNLAYHRDSDRRYDLVSAYIKSIRASHPDAALYWLACMLSAGEDPKYLFRRLLISASEDIGLADPSAIAVVTSCAQAFEWVGLPEGKYHLSQATIYLSTAAKSDSTKALFMAEAHLKRHGPAEVPLHLRDGSYHGAAEHKIGVGYQNPHLSGGKSTQQYLPEGIQRGSFYIPGHQGYERSLLERIKRTRDAGKS